MSRESGMFSVQRPRQTLGAISHNASGIPMPASVMKRSSSQNNLAQAPHTTNHQRTTSGSRMSLAPTRPAQPVFHRSSSGNNLADMAFSTVQRPSTANFLGGASARKSCAPVASTPASNPMQMQESTARRSSVYSGRPSGAMGPNAQQSFFTTAPPQNGIPADPRRLRDRTTQAVMGQELGDFLTERNFELETKYNLSPKCMTSPTQKDFNMMFTFLYKCIDPSYRLQKSIDAEVPPLLKQIRYPFEKSITKSHLVAVGGNNWPTFLGLLHWMMNLAKMMDNYSTGVYDEACIEAGFDVTPDRITFQFLSDAYREWLSIDDDDDDEEESQKRIQSHIEAMQARFAQANEANLEHVRMLEAESKALQEQIDELAKSAPMLAKLDETIKVLEEDRVKFENYNASMDSKVDKYMHRQELLQQEIERCEAEMQEADHEREELQRKVDERGLSIQDIDRMHSERERLQKGVETTAARLEESKERTAKKEAETSAKLDELESLVERYNRLGYQIGVIPSTASNAHGNEYELRLNVNQGPNFSASQLGASSRENLEADRLLVDIHHGYQPQNVLDLDLRACKKALQDLRKEIYERRNAALEEDMARVDMLDKTKEALEDKHQYMEGLRYKLGGAQEEFEKTKEITNSQNMASDTQIERMEKELSKIRASLTESVQLMEQREMSTNLEYDELTHRASRLREDLHTELERMLNEIIQFKIHIQQSLEHYEDFVAGEVDQEWQEQEREREAAKPGADQLLEEIGRVQQEEEEEEEEEDVDMS
ncbi:putative kinetochore protein ndc80 [Teratosphaeria destructans]|uniref:Kinetochore protein NDC80 n=1 Tax=Teratosphaeria destructans TaxID=418781 RepID=A0A9W7SLA8_9PEZI|nr:putative kinetochore protein ndc80 [Teratosphaeria destructans]